MPPRLSPADFLRSRPPGAQQWLDTFGSSMSPFLVSGDAVLVERGQTLVSGDIAILGRDDGQLLAHLVTCPEPLRTSTLLGFEDSAGLQPLGRAVRVRARGVEVPVNATLRRSLLAAHSVLSIGRARAAVHVALAAPGVKSLRRGLLRPEVRALEGPEEAAALKALGDLGTPFPPDVLRIAFVRGVVVGAVANGKVLSLAVLVPAREPMNAQVSMAGMAARGRNLGLEARMVALVVAEARSLGFRRLEAVLVAHSSLPAVLGVGFEPEEEGGTPRLTLGSGR